MLQRLTLLVVVSLSVLVAMGFAQAASGASVLIVLSSEGRDAGQTRPGFEMDELAQAWAIFRAAGVRMTFASPRGGAVEADKYDAADPDNALLLGDRAAVAQLRDTRPLAEMNASDFDAIYVIGGKGAMFDLANDASLGKIIADLYGRGGVVAAICHGSAALAEVRLGDGRYLVEGRVVTGFTAEEEAIFGKRWAHDFPFQLEDRMRLRRARWSEAPLMMPKLAVDGRLVTGQNPYSTRLVATAVLRALGREPVSRPLRRDEASLALIERFVQGDVSAKDALAAAPDRFRPELIAIVGHYQLQAADEPEEVRAALAAMDLAAPHFHANELSLSRAVAMHRLGRDAEARHLLAEVLATHPDMPEARALLEKLAVSE